MMIEDDNDGQMIFGDLGVLKLPDICLTGEIKNPEKSHPGILSRPGMEPGPAACEARMLPPGPQRWTLKVKKNYIFSYREMYGEFFDKTKNVIFGRFSLKINSCLSLIYPYVLCFLLLLITWEQTVSYLLDFSIMYR